MMEKDRIYTENLQVGYDHRVVVDGVEVQAVKGKMICLLGPNGAGKSTILRTLSGMLAPVRGTVYLDGEKVTQMEKSTLARKMAVVLTERLSPGMMTAFEIAAMGRHPYTGFFGKLKEEDKAIVMESLRSVNAENLAFRYYEELSDGEKQKVMIARALAQQPELIVLDEPTSHLDIRHRIEVVNILGKLCRESKKADPRKSSARAWCSIFTESIMLTTTISWEAWSLRGRRNQKSFSPEAPGPES